MTTRTDKGYKGIVMEGPIARMYASNTGKNRKGYQDLARHIVARTPSGSRILEVAPGPGYLSIELAKTGDYTVVGLDISRTFIEIARNEAAHAQVQVDFRHGNGAAMPFDDESFDLVVCRAAFKNFSQPVQALQEMHRVLRPGGRAVVVDLRRDVSKRAVDEEVAGMGLGGFSRAFTRVVLGSWLPRRAYTKEQFEGLISQTRFTSFDVHETGLSLEAEMRR